MHSITILTGLAALPLSSAAIIHSYIPWSKSASSPFLAASRAFAGVPEVNTTVQATTALNTTSLAAASPLAASRQLSNGLDLAVMVQQAELAATTDLLTMARATIDPAVYAVGKENLQIMLNASIKLRINNMALAKNDTSLLRGLAQLEGAQAKEMGMVNSLKGEEGDVKTLQALQAQFQRGIMVNRSLVTEVCCHQRDGDDTDKDVDCPCDCYRDGDCCQQGGAGGCQERDDHWQDPHC